MNIDKEFKSLIPALTSEEYSQLEKNILSEGCRDALITWDGTLIDGHNRYEICSKHGIPFGTSEKAFEDRDQVIDWIINNQLGRRNLTRETQSYLRGLQYEREKKKSFNTENLKQNTEKDKMSPSATTAERLAKQHNVNEKTIKRDAEYSKAIDEIVKNTSPEIKQKILNREIEITKIETEQLSRLEPGKQKEIINKIIENNVTVKKAIQEVRREEIKIEKPKVLNGLFDVIYADPPWKYDFSETSNRAIENKYPSMDIEDIKAIKVPTEDNAVLFMWATAPKLIEALEVLKAWGFNYKTNAIWDKEVIGMGYWFRGQHEMLLVGTKGNYSPPTQECRESSVYRERRTEHSKKPLHYYELIEESFPSGKYLEMFSRNKFSDKWEVWGNQCE